MQAKPKTKTKPAAVRPISRDEETIIAREARIAATLDLKDLSDAERIFLANCQKIYRRHSGCTSPFENFFWDLVFHVGHGNWPTPDDVERRLGTFKDEFDSMSQQLRYFAESYPAILTTSEI